MERGMERSLDPFSLRLFVAVCDAGSIARAAAKEAIVASAVSKRLAALEHAAGTALLTRARRGVTPTAAGQVMLREARQLLQSLGRLQSELGAFAGGNSLDNTLRVVKIVPTEWVLLDIQVDGIANGFGHGTVRLYARDGTLMATASQSTIVRFWAEERPGTRPQAEHTASTEPTDPEIDPKEPT